MTLLAGDLLWTGGVDEEALARLGALGADGGLRLAATARSSSPSSLSESSSETRSSEDWAGVTGFGAGVGAGVGGGGTS